MAGIALNDCLVLK